MDGSSSFFGRIFSFFSLLSAPLQRFFSFLSSGDAGLASFLRGLLDSSCIESDADAEPASEPDFSGVGVVYLRHLNLDETQLSDVGIAALAAALPNLS